MCLGESLGKIVLPVLKENQYEEYPYSKSGTGIRICHNKNHFFVTAEHVVSDTIDGKLIPRPPEEILVPENNSSRIFIPLIEKINVDSKSYIVEKDIAFFKIQETSCLNASLISNHVDCELNSGDELLVFGYPCQKNVVDCEAKKIKRFIKAYSAHFISRIDMFHSRLSIDLDDGEILDGVSGGAVFKKTNMKLCGMMLKADKSGLAEMYNVDVIIRIMDDIVNKKG